MRDQKDPPLEVANYYQEFVKGWLVEGFQSSLKYENDEFRDGWSIDIYLPGSERDPEISNIPADGSVPHFMLAKCIYSFQKGHQAGLQMAADQFVVQAASSAAADAIKLIRTGPMWLKASIDVCRLSDPGHMTKAVTLLKEDSKK